MPQIPWRTRRVSPKRAADVAERLRGYQRGLEELDFAGRRRLLGQLFDEVTIDTRKGTLLFKGCVVSEVALNSGARPVTLSVPLAVSVHCECALSMFGR